MPFLAYKKYRLNLISSGSSVCPNWLGTCIEHRRRHLRWIWPRRGLCGAFCLSWYKSFQFYTQIFTLIKIYYFRTTTRQGWRRRSVRVWCIWWTCRRRVLEVGLVPNGCPKLRKVGLLLKVCISAWAFYTLIIVLIIY